MAGSGTIYASIQRHSLGLDASMLKSRQQCLLVDLLDRRRFAAEGTALADGLAALRAQEVAAAHHDRVALARQAHTALPRRFCGVTLAL